MESEDYAQIGLIIDRLDRSARISLDKRLASHTAEVAKASGLGHSRRWISFCGIMEDEGLKFIVACLEEVGKVTREAEGFGLIGERVAAFIAYLDEVFQSAYSQMHAWQGIGGASNAPDAWRNAKYSLQVEFSSRRSEFLTPPRDRTAKVAQPEMVSQSVLIKNKGGKPLAAHWDDMWAEIAVQLWVGDLQPETQADIKRAMLAWFTEREINIGDTAVTERARRLWQKYQAAQ